eukprot:scaffold454_cov124-Isochrysis_galbana.AAC.1
MLGQTDPILLVQKRKTRATAQPALLQNCPVALSGAAYGQTLHESAADAAVPIHHSQEMVLEHPRMLVCCARLQLCSQSLSAGWQSWREPAADAAEPNYHSAKVGLRREVTPQSSVHPVPYLLHPLTLPFELGHFGRFTLPARRLCLAQWRLYVFAAGAAARGRCRRHHRRPPA